MDSSGPTQKLTTQQAQNIMQNTASSQYGQQDRTRPSPRTGADGSGSSPDFLRIIPCNERAKFAFSELIKQRDSGNLDYHHAQYIVSDGEGSLNTRQALDHKSSDDSADPDFSECESCRIVNLK